MEKNYFIKKGYKCNILIENINKNENIYWNNYRIKMSKYDQYYAYKLCQSFIKEKKINNILDIGCGTAIKLMKFLYPVCKNIYGIDRKFIVKYCKKKYGLNTFLAVDIENPTIKLEHTFDLILSIDVIEHLLDPDKLLNFIKTYCHKYTYIILSTPERDILRGKDCNFSPNKAHIREWNQSEFLNYLKYHNFSIIMNKIVKSSKFHFDLKLIIKKMIYLLKFKRVKSKSCQFIVCQINSDKGKNF